MTIAPPSATPAYPMSRQLRQSAPFQVLLGLAHRPSAILGLPPSCGRGHLAVGLPGGPLGRLRTVRARARSRPAHPLVRRSAVPQQRYRKADGGTKSSTAAFSTSAFGATPVRAKENSRAAIRCDLPGRSSQVSHQRTLLLSLRPRYATAILTGDKTTELRRRPVNALPGTPIILYASSPIMAVVGTARLADVHSCFPRLA